MTFPLFLLAPGKEAPPHMGLMQSKDDCIQIENPGAVIVIGANGSGKTRLGSWIDLLSPHAKNAVRISAQKSLSMMDLIQPKSIDIASAELRLGYNYPNVDEGQIAPYKSGNRWASKPATALLDDFGKLLTFLFSQQAEIQAQFWAANKINPGKVEQQDTMLDLIKRTWEKLLPHRELIIGGAKCDTKIRGRDESVYPSAEMSDGERVILYLLGQVLAAPPNFVIVVDEPELHVHKSLQATLWQSARALRPDCLFVLITHDVDFAAALADVPKIWLKSFDGKTWDWSLLPIVSGLPEDLLLEVLGSRRSILFVEGENGSLDVELYRLLFPDFLVLPRGSCTKVINDVRAMQAITGLHRLQVYGLIDRDRRGDAEVTALNKDNVFVLKVAEVENLFAVKEILVLCASQLHFDAGNVVQQAQEMLKKMFAEEIDAQISMHVSEEVKYRLNTFDVKKRGDVAIGLALEELFSSIDVTALYQTVQDDFQAALASGEMSSILFFYNRKSISSRLGALIGLKNDELPKFVLRLAYSDATSVRNALRSYLPEFP